MKYLYYLLMAMTLFLNSCAVVGGIFKAGVYWGVFIMIVLVGLILYLVTRSRK